MRVVVIAALLLTATTISVGQQNPPQAKHQKNKAKDQAVQPSPAPVPEVRDSTPASAPAPQAKEQTPQPELKPLLSHGEWVMGVLTAIYVLISFFSFRAIQRQADIAADSAVAANNAATAAQDAARAAERNTEALMNIERPWLIVTGVRYDLLPTTTPDGRSENRSHVHVSFQNFGRSPAWPVAQSGRLKAFNKPADLPEEPDYGTTEQIESYGIVLPPNAEGSILDLPLEGEESDFSRVIHGELFWFAYGFLAYRGIFGRIHETHFCFVASGGNACVFRSHQAPPRYNQCT